jgi:hypothetical protein
MVFAFVLSVGRGAQAQVSTEALAAAAQNPIADNGRYESKIQGQVGLTTFPKSGMVRLYPTEPNSASDRQ